MSWRYPLWLGDVVDRRNMCGQDSSNAQVVAVKIRLPQVPRMIGQDREVVIDQPREIQRDQVRRSGVAAIVDVHPGQDLECVGAIGRGAAHPGVWEIGHSSRGNTGCVTDLLITLS